MVLDPRAKKLADIVVNYSLEINSKDSLLIQSEDTFREFAEHIAEIAKNKGAAVTFAYKNLNSERELIERNDKTELQNESKRLCDLAEKSTARAYIYAFSNPLYLKGVDSKKIADYQAIVNTPLIQRIVGDGKNFKGIKWNLVAYPNEGEAKMAGMSLREYEDFVYSATNIDWINTKSKLEKVKTVFDNANSVHIVGDRTDLKLSLKGRGANCCIGKINMPDGEVYYGPVEDSAEGEIFFKYPVIVGGNEIEGIKLKYSQGEIKEFSAAKNQDMLVGLLNLKGMKRLGEFGIGCNYGLSRYVKNMLFDEKIGGTIHLALGRSYKRALNDGGGLNDAEMHVDLVCDLRDNGKLFVDDKLVQENGRWLF